MATINQPKTFIERDDWLRAVNASDLPPVAVRVALAIGMHLRVKTGRCDPSFAGIATASHVSERTVYRLVSLLEHAGWIGMQRSGGRQRNQYTLLNPDTAPTGSNPDTASSGCDEANPDTASSGSTLTERASNPDNMVAVKKRRTTKKEREGEDIYTAADFASPDSGEDATAKPDRKNRTPKASADQAGDNGDVTSLKLSDLDAAFAEFYASCPRKFGPIAARREYDAAVIKRGVDPAKILAAIKRYAVEVEGREPLRIKNPANWLRDGYYDNEPLPGTGPPTIDNSTGHIIDTPSPRPSRAESHEEMVERLRAEYAQERKP